MTQRPLTARELGELSVPAPELFEWARTDLTTRVGPHECEQQLVEPIRYDGDAPQFQCHAHVRPLRVVELDRPTCPDRFELLDDRLAPGNGAELSEQRVALVQVISTIAPTTSTFTRLSLLVI